MIRAWGPDQIREAEAELMAGLPDGELMQRASRGLAEVVGARLREVRGSRVVVLAGRGDNGGDALYAAAALAADGATVVAVHGDWPLHAESAAAARGAGVDVVPIDGDWRGPMGEADVVVDGLLGIGGRPGLPPQGRELVDAVPDTAYVIAVDIPSGVDPRGRQPGDDVVFADESVTFSVARPAHLLPPMAPATGRLTVIEIGVDPRTPPQVERLTHDDVADLWPVPGPGDDKYSRGVLGVVAGGEGYTGAPLLTVTTAVCAGAGMVRYVGPPTPTGLIRSQVPEAVIGAGRVQAWTLGPGLDAGDETPAGLAQVAAATSALASGVPCLVDAGALDLLDGERTTPTLLTPHAGEAARLLSRLGGEPVSRADVQARPLDCAQRLADLTGATVLLKGAITLVVPPGGGDDRLVRSQDDGPAWLATAGAGDVLAGLGGMLLAAGLSPLDAGSLAALVHGVAADRANPGGPVRALAVAHALPGTIAALLRR